MESFSCGFLEQHSGPHAVRSYLLSHLASPGKCICNIPPQQMHLGYTATVNVHPSFKTGGALPTVLSWNSWEIFTLALEAPEVLGQIPSMCLNGENDPFPNYPFKGGDRHCEIVSYQMDRSAASGALWTSSNCRLWSRLRTTVGRGGGVYFSD